jgi:hypothetical protein
MGGNLRDKFISNTYTKIFQKSELPEAEGNENIDLNAGLTDDSLTFTNGLGQKVRFFVLDVGDPSYSTGNGIYIQTQNMKSSGDFGLRFNSNNERGQITSKNKDILISSDFNNQDTNDNLNRRRRLILKGGIPGTMSASSNDDDLNGGSVGNPEQLTLQLQGRLSVEHDEAIFLNDNRNQELGLMSGVFRGEGPEELQIWSKVGNVVNVCGSWRWDPSSIGGGSSTVPMYLMKQNVTNYILPVSNSTGYNSSSGVFTINQDGSYTISGTIWVRYERIAQPPNSGPGFINIFGANNSIRPNIRIIKNGNSSPVFFDFSYVDTLFGPLPSTPVPVGSPIGTKSQWVPLTFSHNEQFNNGDTFEIKYSINTTLNSIEYEILTTQFNVEFGNGSFVQVNGTTIASMGSGDAGGNPDYSTDLRFPLINGNPVNKVWGNAKFRNTTTPNWGSVRPNDITTDRPISASFYQGNTLSIQSSGPVDFSYSYILEF